MRRSASRSTWTRPTARCGCGICLRRNLAALLSHFRTWPPGSPHRRPRRGAVGGDGHRPGAELWPAAAPVPRQPRRRNRAHPRGQGVGGQSDLRGDAPSPLSDRGRRPAAGALRRDEAAPGERGRSWRRCGPTWTWWIASPPTTRPTPGPKKRAIKPPPGVPGLETMLPLLLTAVAEGRLDLERLVELTHDAPRRIFGLPRQPDTWVEVDPGGRYILGHEGLHTKCGWTPFAGIGRAGPGASGSCCAGRPPLRQGRSGSSPALAGSIDASQKGEQTERYQQEENGGKHGASNGIKTVGLAPNLEQRLLWAGHHLGPPVQPREPGLHL